MTRFQGAIIDGIGADNLDKAIKIAEDNYSLDASADGICFIDTGSQEVLDDLLNAGIISSEDHRELINSLIMQLVLVA